MILLESAADARGNAFGFGVDIWKKKKRAGDSIPSAKKEKKVAVKYKNIRILNHCKKTHFHNGSGSAAGKDKEQEPVRYPDHSRADPAGVQGQTGKGCCAAKTAHCRQGGAGPLPAQQEEGL